MPLTADHNAPRAEGDLRSGVLAASQTVFKGALLMRNTTTGHIRRGAVATGCIGIGRAEERVSSTGAGATPVTFRPGTFRYRNSTSADAITVADIGKVCFVIDDDRVAKTDGSGARSPAGVVEAVDGAGVWVRLDEAVTAGVLS